MGAPIVLFVLGIAFVVLLAFAVVIAAVFYPIVKWPRRTVAYVPLLVLVIIVVFNLR